MELKVLFSRMVSFLGRNGNFKNSGVSVSSFDDVIEIIPITSKGKLASAHIQIPKEDIPHFIETLKKVNS